MGISMPVRLRTVEDYIVSRHGFMRQLTLAEFNVLRAILDDLVEQIQENWPIDTGLSMTAFEWTIQSTPELIGFTILNDVDYVEFIHRRGTSPDPPLWLTLIPALLSAYKGRINTALIVAVDRTEGHIRRGRSFLDLLQLTAEQLGAA